MHNTRPLALVTGGSRGIGFAIAESFAKSGYDLLLLSKNAESLREAKKSLGHTTECNVECMACDLSDASQISSFASACSSRSVIVDVLVLCAATFIEGTLASADLNTFDYTMAVNIRGMYLLTQLLLPQVKQSAKPRIVIIGSTAGLEPYKAGAIYGVSKWATRGFAVNLREELKPDGVGVTLITPGGTLTDLWAEDDLPPDRLLKPEDIAKLVVATLTLSNQAVVEEIVVRPILGDLH